MARKNPHIGSSFESWLEGEGIREEVNAAAIKAVIARQLAREMKKKKITKQRMAELMKTSRAQLDRLLDPDNGSATIESLQRAAKTECRLDRPPRIVRALRRQPKDQHGAITHETLDVAVVGPRDVRGPHCERVRSVG